MLRKLSNFLHSALCYLLWRWYYRVNNEAAIIRAQLRRGRTVYLDARMVIGEDDLPEM
jgi:hypothetical protein